MYDCNCYAMTLTKNVSVIAVMTPSLFQRRLGEKLQLLPKNSWAVVNELYMLKSANGLDVRELSFLLVDREPILVMFGFSWLFLLFGH